MKPNKTITKKFVMKKPEVMTFEEYITDIAQHPERFASPAERLLKAIGPAKFVDTAKDDSLSRLFGNRIIKTYDTFSDFYGMESVIEQIVSFYTHAAQGLEESKQILYLLGPVGSAKSSIAERLKELMAREPIYAIQGSPIQESPLGLLDKSDAAALGIPERYLKFRPSPWALKRLDEYDGDMTKFNVVKLYPDESRQIAIAKTEPGDENNQDISTLVGKINIRMLEKFSQDDPDAYNFSGGLGRANQGILDFVEMFKAPIKMLHPLLTATQEGNYKGTEPIAAIPFDGLIIAHSNEAEWTTFSQDHNNEAFLDRITIVRVPYVLRVDEEVKIYRKLLDHSNLKDAICAPGTLEMLASLAILSRLDYVEDISMENKLDIYNGLRVSDPAAKSYITYSSQASGEEGFNGMSTRQAFKILAKVFNYSHEEIAANPVHLLVVLREFLSQLDISPDERTGAQGYISDILLPRFKKEVEKDIQTSYLDAYQEFGQSLFDKYIDNADHWIQERDYRDANTGQLFDRSALEKELSRVEKPAGISNPKDFRSEIVNFVLRYRAKHAGANPDWKSYERIKDVIEANLFEKTTDLLPLISFNKKGTAEEQKRHDAYVERMVNKGYTKAQVQLVTDWYIRHANSV